MKITVFGGDERAIAALFSFIDKGFDAEVIGIGHDVLDAHGALKYSTNIIPQSGVILFPLPFSADGEHVNCPFSEKEYSISDVFRSLGHARAFCGMASTFHKKLAREYSVDLVDYYECEELQIMNALPTAEGAISIFMQKKKITVFGSRCTVAGGGRVGKCLADKLSKLGADVTVAARRETDLAWCRMNKIYPLRIDELVSNPFSGDCLFNTVPCNIFDKSFAAVFPESAHYIELASKPHGISPEDAKLLGDKYIEAPSLPGKYAPVTAGKIIADTVSKYI